jgi:hypothetical protein
LAVYHDRSGGEELDLLPRQHRYVLAALRLLEAELREGILIGELVADRVVEHRAQWRHRRRVLAGPVAAVLAGDRAQRPVLEVLVLAERCDSFAVVNSRALAPAAATVVVRPPLCERPARLVAPASARGIACV